MKNEITAQDSKELKQNLLSMDSELRAHIRRKGKYTINIQLSKRSLDGFDYCYKEYVKDICKLGYTLKKSKMYSGEFVKVTPSNININL